MLTAHLGPALEHSKDITVDDLGLRITEFPPRDLPAEVINQFLARLDIVRGKLPATLVSPGDYVEAVDLRR